MIHPDTELRFINPEVGWGVVATKFIPKGTITWAFDHLDQVLTHAEIAAMDKFYQDILYKYTYRDHLGNFIFCWDFSRFVNHSFHTNCMSTAYNFELAIRDIQAGEELTNDYGYLNPMEPFDCLPEPGTNRTRVMPDDLLNFHAEWDALLIDAFRYYKEVSQPLAFLIEEQYRDKVSRVVKGEVSMDSILNCYYDENKISR